MKARGRSRTRPDPKKPDADDQLVYKKAEQAVLEMVEGPEYSAGDRIPSERDLSERFRISRMTMRKALTNLVRAGVLERRGTSGTFVAVPRVQRPLDGNTSASISEIVEHGGGKPGSKLLFFESAAANERVAERLGVEPGSPLIVIRRLRTANGVPFCVETSYVPAARVPGLIAGDLLGNASLYGLLKERYGIKVGTAESVLSVAPTTAYEAELLGLAPDAPAMVHRAVVLDQQGRPIEYVTSVNHPQRVVFRSRHGGVGW